MRKTVSAYSLLIVVILLGTLYLNRQWVRDMYVVQTMEVQAAAEALKSSLGLTAKADFIYHASLPEIQQSAQFNQSCQKVQREQSIVLGCYTSQRFYVFDVDDSRLDGVKQVTAAHELLHAVYERLPEDERAVLDGQLRAAAQTITDQRFNDTLQQYQKTEPDQIANELHSILGTEISTLPGNLETHYQKYFKNRAIIVAYAKQYEQAFTSLDDQIKEYDAQLAALNSQKDSLEASLGRQQSNLQSSQERLSQLRASNNISAYNQAVPEYNEQIRQYNAGVVSLKEIINQYNDLVEDRNKLATTQNDLAHELNSNYQTVE